VTTQISTIELNPELANMAYEMGLNIEKTCENSLKEAIRRLQGVIHENTSVRNAVTT
jgi:exonuclease VII small subunit